MKHRTSSLQLCGQPTVLTLTQSTNRFRGSCRIVCTAARFVMSTSWTHAWSKSGNIFTMWSSMKRSGSGVHVFELAFEHTVVILNTDFRCADVLPFARTQTWQSITPVPIYWTLMLLSDLTKLAVDVADVDRFCWNLVTCLQFNVSVLVQNFVKIRRCLPELRQRIQGYSFLVNTRSINYYCQWFTTVLY